MKNHVTIAGTRHPYGSDFMKKGLKVRLEKEPDNAYDIKAIIETARYMFAYLAPTPVMCVRSISLTYKVFILSVTIMK